MLNAVSIIASNVVAHTHIHTYTHTFSRVIRYNYHGTERMYSGVTGEEFDADIFIGVVYYQRLRHMVSDKVSKKKTPALPPCHFFF